MNARRGWIWCWAGVSRHEGRVMFLRYRGSGPIDKSIFLVGKGVTYDTGGCDVKAGGVMAGMHRDKCGAAAVAAFMKVRHPCDHFSSISK